MKLQCKNSAFPELIYYFGLRAEATSSPSIIGKHVTCARYLARVVFPQPAGPMITKMYFVVFISSRNARNGRISYERFGT